MKIVLKKLKIFSTHFLHFGRGIGPFEMELNKMEPQYIKDLGNWKPDTQYECYLAKITINIMKVMLLSFENHRVHYNPRTVTEPRKQLQIPISPFIE